ncbi:Deoxyadenosine/deoxycytidine kinase [compost metagenome]
MHERYSVWINRFTACPVLRLNIDEYDVHDSASVDAILEQIAAVIKPSKEAQV